VSLSPDETRRYARQLVLKDIGGAGQQKLQAAKVLVIGAGGLGSPVIAYLAAAGVGTLGVVDDDVVALSNLQRQIVHSTASIGESKAASAGLYVRKLNDEVAFVAHTVRLDVANAETLFQPYDVIVDGSDNFVTHRLAAETATKLGKPLVAGGVMMWSGQLTVYLPGGKGFADLYPVAPADEAAQSCEAVGVLGAVTGVIGTLMAVEAIKLIAGAGGPLSGRLLLYDGRSATFTEIAY
jgi:molybdopterin/thiamine biosynthesis adenylyltransferase